MVDPMGENHRRIASHFLLIWINIGPIQSMPQYVELQLMQKHNSAFSIHPL